MAVYMNRNTRKVLSFLSSVFKDKGIEYTINHREIYLTDKLMVTYQASPVINLLKTKIKHTKLTDRHATMSYWASMMDNIFKSNHSACRPNAQEVEYTIPDELASMIYWQIVSGYLICDYSYDDMILLQQAVNKYSNSDIEHAIKVSKSQRIHEPRYLSAVLEKQSAKDEYERQKLENMDRRIQESNQIFDRKIHQHSILDIAQAEYSWKNRCENMRLEQEMDKLAKRGW